MDERGRGSEKYVMARHEDKGGYSIGNVKIIMWIENVREGLVGKKRPREVVEKISAKLKGKKKPRGWVEKVVAAQRGRFVTFETRKKLSAVGMGRIPWNKGKLIGPFSEEHKNRISASVRAHFSRRDHA